MSRRRGRSPQQDRDEGGLSPRQMRALMKEYGIEFGGHLTPSQWPESYSQLFLRIRETGRTEFDKYLPDPTADRGPIVNAMKQRIKNLIKMARNERLGLGNEATLRMNSEHPVFSRFTDEVKCPTCLGFRWLPEFSALPSNQVEADKLERRRAERALCRCPPETSSWESPFDDPSETLRFRSCGDACVEYDRRDGLKERGLRRRKPDRVIGLAWTKSLEYYSRADAVQGLRHSPFANEAILYPFLIHEAKPEGGPGFEYIETQTAFPIRTCVKLQEDLQQRTGVPINPLVWFMSNEGDEWRVAGCIKHQDKYQVIDLWMGRATSREGALQLLLIIDAICVWARKTFRFNILCCLAGGKDNLHLRNLSPTATYDSRSSTQEPQSDRQTSSQRDTRVRPSINSHSDSDVVDLTGATDLSDLELGDTVMEDHTTAVGDEDDTVDTCLNVAPHSLLRWAHISPTQVPWTHDATIRHSNMALLSFSHLALPNDLEALASCVNQASNLGAGPTRDIANTLATSFLHSTGAMTTTTNRILQLKNEWLRKHSQTAGGSDTPVRALFSFHTYLRTSDWQIVRELRCISCASDAVHALAGIGGFDSDRGRASTRWSTDMHPFSSSCFSPLQSLTRNDSVTAAINSTVLYLVVKELKNDQPDSQWVTGTAPVSVIEAFARLYTRTAPRLTPTGIVDQGSTLMEVLEKPTPQSIRTCLGTQMRADSSAILLSKGQHWPRTVPQWCLMVLEEVDFEDNRELGRSLAMAKGEGFCYTFGFSGSHDGAGEPMKVPIDDGVDGRFLDSWIEDLST